MHLQSLSSSPQAGEALPCLSRTVLQSVADYGFLVSQNTKLLSALEDLRHRCSSLAEENSLLVSRGCGPIPRPGEVLGRLPAQDALWGGSPGQGKLLSAANTKRC